MQRLPSAFTAAEAVVVLRAMLGEAAKQGRIDRTEPWRQQHPREKAALPINRNERRGLGQCKIDGP